MKKDYQILIVLTDGDLTDIGRDAQAIIDASNFSISIIALGIGIGPFTSYSEFDNVLFREDLITLILSIYQNFYEQGASRRTTLECTGFCKNNLIRMPRPVSRHPGVEHSPVRS